MNQTFSRLITAILVGTVLSPFAKADVPVDLPSLGVHPVCVTSGTDNQKPMLAIRPAGGVYMAWAHTEGTQPKIVFARSEDGIHFSAPATVSGPGMFLDLGAENAPNIAIDAHGSIYVVWTAGASAATKSGAATGAEHAGHNHAAAAAAGSDEHTGHDPGTTAAANGEHAQHGGAGKKSGGHPPRPGQLGR